VVSNQRSVVSGQDSVFGVRGFVFVVWGQRVGDERGDVARGTMKRREGEEKGV